MVYDGYTYFADGDLCIAKITPCFENGKGALAAGLTSGVGFGTTELHVVRPGPNIDPRFLFYVSIADDFRKLGESELCGAGGQKRIDESFIKDWMAPLPQLDTQRWIDRPPIVVPPTVLVQPPPEAWGEGRRVSGVSGRPDRAGSLPEPGAGSPESYEDGWCCTRAATVR